MKIALNVTGNLKISRWLCGKLANYSGRYQANMPTSDTCSFLVSVPNCRSTIPNERVEADDLPKTGISKNTF